MSMRSRKRSHEELRRILEEQQRTHQLLETGDVARLLQCSTDMVRYLARRGRLPENRLPSGRRLFHVDDVRRFAVSRGIAIDAA